MTGTWRILSICLFVGIPVAGVVTLFTLLSTVISFVNSVLPQ